MILRAGTQEHEDRCWQSHCDLVDKWYQKGTYPRPSAPDIQLREAEANGEELTEKSSSL